MGDKSKVLKPSMKKAKKAPESAPAKTPEPVKKADPKPQPKKYAPVITFRLPGCCLYSPPRGRAIHLKSPMPYAQISRPAEAPAFFEW